MAAPTEQTIAQIEERATKARVTMTDVCKEASVGYSTWWRAKQNPEKIRISVIGKWEDALSRIEKRRAEA